MPRWNPWHGCTKISEGCRNCYVYNRDEQVGRDAAIPVKTATFSLPVQKNRRKEYRLRPEDGMVYTCFTSDFFHPAADEWRIEAWQMIRQRKDLKFLIITKRPERFFTSLPEDWGSGYENVTICCSCENQTMTDQRLPVFLELPIRHREIVHAPLLGAIDIRRYLEQYGERIEGVTCGGESGRGARLCDYRWVLSIREQCVEYGIPFHFQQTGSFFLKDGKIYRIDRKNQLRQAAKANIDYRYL